MGETSSREGEPRRRSVVYCVIPADLAPKLHELLHRHFEEDPRVEVVVEQRGRERRRRHERRTEAGEAPTGQERRRIRSDTGRRMGERRVPVVTLDAAGAPELPRRARRHLERLSFVERFEPAGEHSEDLDTARLIARVQADEPEAFAALYTRYFSRVYGYLRVLLKDSHEAEDVTQQVFLGLLEKLPAYERRSQPFRAWLFTVVRNQALDHIAKRSRVELMEAGELSEAQDRLANRLASGAGEQWQGSPELSSALSWISNDDLLILIGRLPGAQRQVLSLRFMLGLAPREIAEILGTTPNNVSALQYRALAFLRERLTAVGREPHRGRARMARCPRKAPVLRLRRFALTK